MRIALATDAGAPQTNGVVTTLKATAATLAGLGHDVRVISPQGLTTIAGPSYPEIQPALAPGACVARELRAVRPQAIPATTQFLAGLAPIPLPRRARLAVSRSSAMIACIAARGQASGTGDAN